MLRRRLRKRLLDGKGFVDEVGFGRHERHVDEVGGQVSKGEYGLQACHAASGDDDQWSLDQPKSLMPMPPFSQPKGSGRAQAIPSLSYCAPWDLARGIDSTSARHATSRQVAECAR